jgi:type I restriction enzyme S subunit
MSNNSSLIPKLRFPEFRKEPAWAAINGNELFDPIDRRPAAPGLPILAITQEHGAIPRDQIDYHVSVSESSLASYKEVRPADFIISLRSFQGGIEYSKFNGICSPAYIILKRKGEGEDHFFRHLFKSDRFIQQLTRNIEGLRDGKMISFKQFSEQLIPAPSPAEQRKIADCLSSLDELIAAEGRKLESLRAYKKGLMQQLFPRAGETTPRLRFPEFRNAREWATQELGPKTIKVGSGITPTGGEKVYKKSGRPFIRSQNVGWSELLLDDVAYIDEETHLSFDGTELRVDDVLLNITGASIGRSAIADPRIVAGNVNQHVCIIRVKPDELNPVLLNQYLVSNDGQKQIDSFQAGGNRQGLNFAQIRSFLIPLPPTTEEQVRIAECLSSLDARIVAQSEWITALRTHKKGLMQQLFPAAMEGEE